MKLPVFHQSKLYQAMFCQLVATLAMYPLRMASFSEWATFSCTLFTLYTVSHVTDTHLQQSKNVANPEQTA